MLIVVLLLIAAFLIGLTLFVIGLRGRRIDDHPLCRKCKYDLVGTEKLPTNCPECGAELNNPRATRIGNRKRRRKTLVVGLLILVASLTTSGLLGWAQAKNFDWYPYKPLWVLQSEIEQDPYIDGGEKATAEILLRLENDKLSDRQVRNIVNKALSLQSDPNANRNYFWGDFIEESWLKGKVKDDKLKQYFKFAFDNGNSFNIQTRIRSNDNAKYNFTYDLYLAGSGNRFQAMVEFGPFKLNDEILKKSASNSVILTGGGGSFIGSRLKFPDKLGKFTLTASQHISIYPTEKYKAVEVSPWSSKENWSLRKSLAICDWEQEFTKQIELIDKDAPVIEYITNSDMAQMIRQSTEELYCNVNVHGEQKVPTCYIRFVNLTEAVSFDIYWRIGNKEWLIATVAANSDRQSDRRRQPMIITSDEGFPDDASVVDVILRSNPKHAERLAAVESVWVGEDIVFKDQPLDVSRQDDD